MRAFATVVFLVCSLLALAQDPWKQSNDLVPDKDAAVKIAEAILFPIYGADAIRRERPYNVSLRNGCWYISGSMPQSNEAMAGGTFFITISQADGRVLDIGHFR